MKPSPMLGSVYQVGRSVGWNVSRVLFVLFVVGLHFLYKSVLLISASETS